ncbi:hypothetical protein PR002_g8695, partial [Phytophthora rubi]
ADVAAVVEPTLPVEAAASSSVEPAVDAEVDAVMAAVLSAVSRAPEVEPVEHSVEAESVAVDVDAVETVAVVAAVVEAVSAAAADVAAVAVVEPTMPVETAVRSSVEPAVDAEVIGDVEAAVVNLVTGVGLAVDMVVEPVNDDESVVPGSPVEALSVYVARVNDVATFESGGEGSNASESVKMPEQAREDDVHPVLDYASRPTETTGPCESADFGLPDVDGEVECLVEDVVAVLVAIDESANMKDDDLRTAEEILF